MQLLKEVAQQARFAAMQPGQINQHWAQAHADIQAFERAARLAADVVRVRASKRAGSSFRSKGQLEALARECERTVREIAIQSEIILQRRADLAQADRAMLGIMLGVAS
jgi:hypothetical protein